MWFWGQVPALYIGQMFTTKHHRPWFIYLWTFYFIDIFVVTLILSNHYGCDLVQHKTRNESIKTCSSSKTLFFFWSFPFPKKLKPVHKSPQKRNSCKHFYLCACMYISVYLPKCTCATAYMQMVIEKRIGCLIPGIYRQSWAAWSRCSEENLGPIKEQYVLLIKPLSHLSSPFDLDFGYHLEKKGQLS